MKIKNILAGLLVAGAVITTAGVSVFAEGNETGKDVTVATSTPVEDKKVEDITVEEPKKPETPAEDKKTEDTKKDEMPAGDADKGVVSEVPDNFPVVELEDLKLEDLKPADTAKGEKVLPKTSAVK